MCRDQRFRIQRFMVRDSGVQRCEEAEAQGFTGAG
jgi:hypothetical protein